MAYTGVLEIEGTKYRVRQSNYTLHQNTDENGRPSSQVMGGTIELEVESSDATALLDWMLDKTGKKSGTLTFSKTDEEGNLKTIEFKDAFCVSYTESMDAISNKPMNIKIIISAKSISVAGVSHENVWESKL